MSELYGDSKGLKQKGIVEKIGLSKCNVSKVVREIKNK